MVGFDVQMKIARVSRLLADKIIASCDVLMLLSTMVAISGRCYYLN